MRATREKIQKVNFGLFPSSIIKAQELSLLLDRSISSLLRQLIDDAYIKLQKEKITNEP